MVIDFSIQSASDPLSEACPTVACAVAHMQDHMRVRTPGTSELIVPLERDPLRRRKRYRSRTFGHKVRRAAIA